MKNNNSTLQDATLQQHRLFLLKKMQHFRLSQNVYMPGLGAVALVDLTLSSAQAEDIPPFMPSDLDTSVCVRICVPGLVHMEEQLHEAAAHEALDDVHQLLRIRTAYNSSKIKHITGQVSNTRARGRQHAIDERITSAKTRYRRSRVALVSILGCGSWEQKLQELQDSDIMGLGERALGVEERAEVTWMSEMGAAGLDNYSIALSGSVSTGEG